MSLPVVVHRPRAVIRVWGRDPVRMIHGLATADIEAISADRAAYTTFLTPKGRMVADARVFARPAAGAELLLDTHPEAATTLIEHLRKFIPPLFARFEEVTDAWRVLGVYGDEVSAIAEAGLRAAGVEASLDAGADEGAVGTSSTEPELLAVRTADLGPAGWDLLVGAAAADAVDAGLRAAGATPATPAELEPLRVRAGRPAWGAELTGEVIPLEAGLLDRAISQSKGCYTGQEVIVRILHRGHVNRHLRALRFEPGAVAPRAELFEPGNARPRGVVTSATALDGAGLGLGYVRREIEPPAELRAGSPDGPPVGVAALDVPIPG